MLANFSLLHKPSLSLHSATVKLSLLSPIWGKQVTGLNKKQYRCYIQFNC